MFDRGSARRFAYRILKNYRDTVEDAFGSQIVNLAKRLIDPDDLISSASIHKLYPNSPRNLIERGIDIDVSPLLEHNLHRGYFGPPADFGPTHATPDLFVQELLQPLVCLENNVVMTPDREVVSESINMPGRTHHGLKRAALCRDKVTPISGYATLLRGPSKGYYHAQIDNIPRIALLHAAPYRDLPEIKLLRPSNGPVVNTEIEDYLVPRIAPSNCRIVDLPPDTLYQVEKYLFSSFPGHVYAPHLPTLYHTRIRDEVLPDRPGRRENRIYVSRSKAGRRRIINEDALMEKLHTLGFKRHHLEDYHIKDKIELFYDAEMVVSPNGAGLATLLYTSDIDVLEILPFRKVLINEYFLSRAVGNRHRFILGDGSSVHDDFHVDAERVAEVASDMLAATGAPPLYADAN